MNGSWMLLASCCCWMVVVSYTKEHAERSRESPQQQHHHHPRTARNGQFTADTVTYMRYLYRSGVQGLGHVPQLGYLRRATVARGRDCTNVPFGNAGGYRDSVECSIPQNVLYNEKLVHAELLYRAVNQEDGSKYTRALNCSVGVSGNTNFTASSLVYTRLWFSWSVVNLTELISGMMTSSEDRLGITQWQFTLRCSALHTPVTIHRPLLVVYSRDRESPPLSGGTLTMRWEHRKTRTGRSKSNSQKRGCHRIDMMVDVKLIGWQEFVIQPSKFNAYRCNGTCSHLPSKSHGKRTNHAAMQSLLAVTGQTVSGKTVPPPCCAPDTLDSLQMLFYEKIQGDAHVVLKKVEGLLVSSCSCL